MIPFLEKKESDSFCDESGNPLTGYVLGLKENNEIVTQTFFTEDTANNFVRFGLVLEMIGKELQKK